MVLNLYYKMLIVACLLAHTVSKGSLSTPNPHCLSNQILNHAIPLILLLLINL